MTANADKPVKKAPAKEPAAKKTTAPKKAAAAKKAPAAKTEAAPAASAAEPVTRLTVSRISAATLVTLAANSIARAENTDEGTPSRRASLAMCDKCFGDLHTCAEKNRESDPQVAEMLEAAYQKYQAYLPLHEKAMDAADADKPAAVKAADEALLQVDAMMGTLWGAF